jgi:hypothetical protein
MRLPTAILAVAACLLHGQCPPPAWTAMNQLPGAGGVVNAATSWDPDGAGPTPPWLVIGGSFDYVGGIPAARVAAWDGSAFHALGAGMNADVWALTVWNGELVAAGSFTTAGGAPAPAVARWNGSTWQPVGAGLSSAGILALIVHNGELFAGGQISVGGGWPTSHVARWDGTAWHALGTGPVGGVVQALTVFNGEIVAGTDSAVARWDGVAWQTLGIMSPPPNDLGVTGCWRLAVWNGELIAGGGFVGVGAVTVGNLARWNGTSWQSVGGGTYSPITGLTVVAGLLVVAESRAAVMTWNGAAFTTIGALASATTNGVVYALALHAGQLFAGGDFPWIGGAPASRVASFDGSVWSPVGTGMNAAVSGFTTAYGDLVAGGWFTSIPGGLANGVARWNGSSWASLGSGVDPAAVWAIGTWNGNLVAGGPFTTAGGIPAAHVAMWGGSGWLPLGGGAGGDVRALAEWNGELHAATLAVPGVPGTQGISRWNGTAWLPMGVPLNAGFATVLCPYNGELVAAGSFGIFGLAVSHVASWNGTSWSALGGGVTGTPSGLMPITSLVAHGGDLYAGGNFTTAGGVPAPGIARWDGIAWHAVGSGFTSVTALGTVGAALVAAGTFGGTPNVVASWNGASWQPLGQAADQPVTALADYHGALVAAGSFLQIGGVASAFVAMWSAPRPALAFSQPSGSGAIAISDFWLGPGREYFNLYSFDLCAAGPGAGPYAGLCFSNVVTLLQQAAVPVGAVPFHFVAPGASVAFGPYPGLPVGLTFDAVLVDVTGGVVGCTSTVTRFTVN